MFKKEFKYLIKFFYKGRPNAVLFDTLDDCIAYASAFDIYIDKCDIDQNDIDGWQMIYDKLTDDNATTIRKIVYVPSECFVRLG